MKVLSLFGLKFFEEERSLKFRYIVFLHQLKPKIYFEKQLNGEVLNLDEGIQPKVSVKPDTNFINIVIDRLVTFFEGLSYKESKNAIIYYECDNGVCMLSKSSLTPVMSRGIAPKNLKEYKTMPEQMALVLDSLIEQIMNYYMTHWSNVLAYYHHMKRV
jgi:hypothetical protein